jgi:hypothetical protein
MKPTMHTHAQPEMSQLQRQLLGQEHVKFYTQAEFDEALAFAKAEIMTVAIQTSKQVVMIERQACSEVVKRLAEQEDEGEVSTALVNAAMAIMNRIPSQRQ